MARIEIGKPSIVSYVEAVLNHNSIRAERAVVDRLRECVRRVELDSVFQPFVGSQPERVVAGIAGAVSLGYVIQSNTRQYRARRRKGWEDAASAVYFLVYVAPHPEVGSLGPEIPGHNT